MRVYSTILNSIELNGIFSKTGIILLRKEGIMVSERQIIVSAFIKLRMFHPLFADNFFNHKYTLNFIECFNTSVQMTTFFSLIC